MLDISGLEHCVRRDVPLARYTWLGVGGLAAYLAEPQTQGDLRELIRRCRQCSVRFRVLGDGSNLLVRDQGVPDLVIRLAAPAFHTLEVEGQAIRSGAGLALGRVLARAMACGLAGLEVLAGIPGTVGGAVVGNSGGRLGDIAQFLRSVLVMDEVGEVREIVREAIPFAYRESGLRGAIVLEARFQLCPGRTASIRAEMRRIMAVKRRTQPMECRSAGCVFRNVRGISAGALIERAGLAGGREGGAVVSTRHANFIIADHGATAADILILMERIRYEVKMMSCIEMFPELVVW